MYPTITNITIETSTICNAECIICPNSTEHKRNPHLMSLEDFENILKLFPNLSLISLSGCYDPLTDNRLPQIFDIINKVHPNIEIVIFSNGSLLHKWENLLLSNENLSSIVFSVHGFSNGIYNKIMKNLDRNKTYNNIIHFLETRKNSKNTKLKIAVTFVRTSLNINELKNFKEFWKTQSLDNVHNFELMNWHGILLNYDNLVDKHKITTRKCPMYNAQIVIDAFGNVARCCYNLSFNYGHVLKNGIDNYLSKKRISDTYPDFDCIKCDGWKI